MTWYEELPKVELHVHLEGAVPCEALFALIQKYGGDADVPDIPALQKRFEYRDFAQFIETWSWKNNYLREYEDFSHIAELTARDMADQNIRYAEMFFSPSLFVRHRGLQVQELARAVRRGLDRVPEIEVMLIADLVRDYGPEFEMNTLRALAEVLDRGIIGIGIGGSEHEFPPQPFAHIYSAAREMGLRTTAHAGEAAGSGSVWSALRHLDVERIGHGTRIVHDPGLLDYIAEKDIPIELCPVSNVRIGAVNHIRDHPIRRYFDRGLRISVNTDDPKMFNTALADEYRLLVEECGFTRDEICRLISLGIASSWLPEGKKRDLLLSFSRHPTWRK